MTFHQISSALLILFCTFSVNAQEKDSETQTKKVGWVNYRDIYKEMLWFEKYGGQKNLIQNNLQVLYQDTSSKIIKPQLRLKGKSINLYLTLDATNKTFLPLIKTAYDENAELILSGLPEQHIKNVKFQSSISINLRSDGIYNVPDLYLACKQALQFQNYVSTLIDKKKECLGVRILFSENESTINVKLKTDQSGEKDLPYSINASLFEGSSLKLKSISYFFNQVFEKTQILTKTIPVSIIPIIE